MRESKMMGKLMKLNNYLKEDIKRISEQKQNWQQRLEEEGDITMEFEIAGVKMKYSDIVKSNEDRINDYKAEMEENNRLIEELKGDIKCN